LVSSYRLAGFGFPVELPVLDLDGLLLGLKLSLPTIALDGELRLSYPFNLAALFDLI